MSACPVVELEAIPLVTSTELGDLEGSRETILVRAIDAEGRVGIGEADAPAQAVRELVVMEDLFEWSRGLRSIVIGADPFALRANHAAMLAATLYHARRGLGIHAISAVDVALHDLAARQLDRPVLDLLGGPRRSAITPYATVWAGSPEGRTLGQMMDVIGALAEQALGLGYRALKIELILGDLLSDRELVRCIRESRALVGSDTTLLIDFGYRWQHWRDAARVLDAASDADLFLAEAALQHDDLEGHARLGDAVPMRVGGAEFAATLGECREWLERGRVDVLQADVNRCGGLTELVRIAELAALHGAEVVPHGWRTGITAAAQRHFQAATANCPLVEAYDPALAPSILRSELTRPEPVVVDGRIALPEAPGLGIEVDETVVERYRTDRPAAGGVR